MQRPFWLREPQVLLQKVLLQQARLWSPLLSVQWLPQALAL